MRLYTGRLNSSQNRLLNVINLRLFLCAEINRNESETTIQCTFQSKRVIHANPRNIFNFSKSMPLLLIQSERTLH